jgi:hypothetical protein
LVCPRVFYCLAVCTHCNFSAQYVSARLVLKFDISNSYDRFFIRLIYKVDFAAFDDNTEVFGNFEPNAFV